MDRKEMIWRLKDQVRLCLDNAAELGADAIIAISPEDFLINVQTVRDRDNDIYLSDATVEEAAVAEGLADQDGMDFQSGRNWDLYPVRTLTEETPDGRTAPNEGKIERIVDTYLREPDNSRTPFTE